ncbi:MAG: hypothetical protein ACJ790_06975 [Myxococcaceae bacterium]
MAKPPNYIKAAFLLPANLVALGASAVASVFFGDATPMLFALGAESLYLGTLSSMPRFQRAVRSRESGDEPASEVVALLEDLAPSQREHYFFLKDLRDKILGNYRKLPGGRVLAAGSEPRIDALLTNFLRLLSTLNNYRKYLSATDHKELQTEIASLKSEVASETNERLREVKQKRIEILDKRSKRFEQAAESREVVSHQLAGIEDLLKLTHEQSIAIRDPATVQKQLDVLSAEVTETEETVREMEKFLEFAEELAPAVPHGAPTRVR